MLFIAGIFESNSLITKLQAWSSGNVCNTSSENGPTSNVHFLSSSCTRIRRELNSSSHARPASSFVSNGHLKFGIASLIRSGFFCQNSRKNFSAFSSSKGMDVLSHTSTFRFALTLRVFERILLFVVVFFSAADNESPPDFNCFSVLLLVQ